MVAVLIIPDGAAEPVRRGRPTSLERALTPALDALAAAGAVRRFAATPKGLPPGSETGIPTLLGSPPAGPVSRGALEAAAHRIAVAPGEQAWRIDLRHRDGTRAGAAAVHRALAALRRSLGARQVHHLRGHRLLVVGLERPTPPPITGLDVVVWPAGRIPARTLCRDTIMVCATGAAAGAARLLGAEVIVPAGATGGIDTDLGAKREAALRAIDGGAARVVVHAGAPDEAAHALDADAKVAALGAIDRELTGPLSAAVARNGGRLIVCPDHGTDPATGRHDAAPVPAVLWGSDVVADDHPPVRMTERGAAGRDLLAGSPA